MFVPSFLVYPFFRLSQCPGFSMHAKPEPENKFWSLSTLVAACKFLLVPLPSSDAGARILSQNLTRSGVEVVSRVRHAFACVSGCVWICAMIIMAPFESVRMCVLVANAKNYDVCHPSLTRCFHYNQVLEQILLNAPSLTELNWQLAMLEGHIVADAANVPAHAPRAAGPAGGAQSQLEKRTFVRYANEEYVAPELLPLRDTTAKILLDALKQNGTVRVLNVNGHKGFMRMNFTPNFADREAQYLAAVLRVNSTLTRVDVSVNRIGDEGAIYLAQALRVNRTLKSLNLSHNFIRADGLFAIAEALKGNTSLEDIDIGSQMMQRAGTPVLTANEYERALVLLIESTLKRRRELLDSHTLPSFYGYRTRAQVEALLAPAPMSSCLLYLNPCVANTVCRARKQADGSVEHVLVHSVPGAYSLKRDPTLSPLPSLTACCAWFLANPAMRVDVARLPADLAERVAAFASYSSLWVSAQKRYTHNSNLITHITAEG